jgi:two-component sensor histidine kinase
MPQGTYPALDLAVPAVTFPGSRFELIAAQSNALPPHLGDLLGVLLQAAAATESVGRPVLLPLWTEEAIHRAYAMLRLLSRQAERERGRVKDIFAAGVEFALARSLATAYGSLASPIEDEVVPCADSLAEIILNLGALFTRGDRIVVRTCIEPLSLPAYKRRALVLCASELMINAITHAFRGGSPDARIEISLLRLGNQSACLRVADNGVGFDRRRPDTSLSIAGGLAGLVESDLTYYRTADWTTTAEIVFPIEDAGPNHRQRP